MQLGASGSDSPLIQGPAGWHRAATPPSLFYVWALDKRRLRGGGGWCKGRLSNASNELKNKRSQGKWRPYVARPIWHGQRTWLAVETLIKSGSVFEGAVRGTASWWQHGLCARAKSEVYLNMDLAVTVFLQSSVSRAFLGSSVGSPQSRLASRKAEVFPSRRMKITI